MSIETRNISIPMPADSRAVERQERREQRKERHQAMRKRAASVLGVNLDDILAVCGAVCFVAAAAVAFGCAAALATAGVCLTACSAAVARAARRK